MSRKIENQAVENLWDKWFNGEEIPLYEWHQTFESFQTFDYQSSDIRKRDFSDLIFLGLNILGRENLWEECIKLAELALADADYSKNIREVIQIHLSKAQSLIYWGRQNEAFAYYLEQIRALPKGSMRREAFMLGVILFIEVMRLSKGKHNKFDTATIAPTEVVEFASELAKAHYGHRKLPMPLRDHAEEKSFTWAQVHKALISL